MQFKEPDGSNAFPIDLMIVATSTFEKLSANAELKSFGATSLRVPCPLDLIALKLHALRSSARLAQGKDLPDIQKGQSSL